MEWGRLLVGSLLCGALLFAVGVVFHFLTPLVLPRLVGEYSNAALFRPWGGWTRAYMLAHPWLVGTLFAGVFFAARAMLGVAHLGGAQAGFLYGLAVFCVGALPIYALNLASFQVSPAVVASWAVQSLSQYALAGLAVGCHGGRAGAP
jgi:hypothetical protein